MFSSQWFSKSPNSSITNYKPIPVQDTHKKQIFLSIWLQILKVERELFSRNFTNMTEDE